MRLAGLITDNATVFGKDFRGFPTEQVQETLWQIEQDAVVVKVHTEEQGLCKKALEVCSHLMLTGCPYVDLILADGPEEIIEVYDDSEEYSEISISEENRDFSWSLEQEMRNMYRNHKLNGAANPLLVFSGGQNREK